MLIPTHQTWVTRKEVRSIDAGALAADCQGETTAEGKSIQEQGDRGDQRGQGEISLNPEAMCLDLEVPDLVHSGEGLINQGERIAY